MSSGMVFNMVIENGIGIVKFDDVGNAMNTWTSEAFNSINKCLDVIETDIKANKAIEGIIFISAKQNTFLAGADLKMIEEMTTKEEAKKSNDLFHSTFNRIVALNIPTIAAINGHCLGGGLEFALACSARIAKESPTTLIGLPEVNVGVIPGAGGTQRLPRLIGYPGIDLIMKGEIISAKKAFELGIIDKMVSPEGDLLAEAKSLMKDITKGAANLKRVQYDFAEIDNVMAKVREEVLRKTRGREIPALMTAIRSMQEGIKLPLKDALENEKKLTVQLVMQKETKGTVNTFFLKSMSDKPKAMITKGFKPKPIKKAMVLGFGTMGRGIVIDILRSLQIPVIVKDVPEVLENGKAFVLKTLEGMAGKGKLKVPVEELKNLLTVTSEYSGVNDIDLIIEAVYEDIEIKQKLYKELSKVIKDDAIIASNTSSLSINMMAESITNPSRFCGLHFFSPVWMMQLVEVVRGEKTSQDTIDNILNFAALLKKRPIVCKDNPGFIVNAILLPYLLIALEYVEEGNSIEKVDEALSKFGMPVGPIRLSDEVGIDVPFKALRSMGVIQETLQRVVADGRLGLKKSGKGFFLKDGSVDPGVLPLIVKRRTNKKTEEEIQIGCLEAMVKAGKDLLDRKVISDPRMIDIGMIWGSGFPSDKGGPMKWADLIGMSETYYGKKFYS